MEQSEGIAATFWQLQCGSDWTLPLVELSRGEPRGTTILIADDGKQNAADAAIRLLAAGQRVLALDLFYFGEAKLGKVDVRYALLVGAVGERPLGIQAGQLSCVARWAKSQRPGEKLNLASAGARSSLIALVAAGLNPAEIDGLELQAALPTLKEIIRNNWSVDQKPEMFCFGLLEAFDVPQLEALVLPRPLVRQ